VKDLPSGWVEAPIHAVADVIRGVTYEKSDATSFPRNGYLPILRATNIDGSISLDSAMVYVPEKYVRPEQELRVGDIVVAASSGSASVVGKSAQLHQRWHGGFGAFCSVIRPDRAINSRYLAHFVTSSEIRRRWRALAQGTNINNLRSSDLAGTVVRVAPLAEQERIVAAIEEQFTRLDAGVAALDRAKQGLKSFYLSQLREVREGPWERVPFGEVVENYDGRRVPVKSSLRRPGPYPYYGAQGVIDHVDGFLFDGSFVLIAEDGANLMSRVLPIAIEAHGKVWVNNHAHVVVPHPDVLAAYLTAVLNADPLHGAITGTAQPKLPQKALNRLLIPKPPIPEQLALVARLAEVHDAQRSILASVLKADQRVRSLRSSVLSAAFAGALVPPDSGDAHAGTLIERIAAERSGPNGHKRPRARRPQGTREVNE
jgi:type I restriction enzyme S subunit